MLFSISAAFPSEEDEIVSQRGSPYIVKNTFIDVASPRPERSARRSSSAPPTTCASEHNQDSMRSPCEAECAEILSSGVSTAALDEDEVTSCGGSWEEDSCAGSDSPPPARCSEGVRIALADLLGEPQRAKLSSKAAVFAPSSCRIATPVGQTGLNLPPEVRLQLAEIMFVAEAVLRESSVIHQVRRSENASGWTIVGSIHSAHAAYAKRTLASAGDKMLTAAKQSSKVCMVGAEANPFTPLYGGLGFGVKLAFVEDEATACWNLLGKGFCARGASCKWHHPSWEATVNIQLNSVH